MLRDDLLGELTLYKRFSCFEGKADWTGRAIRITLEVNKDDAESWAAAMAAMRQLLTAQAEWDEKMRAFAARELTSLANDWLEDADAAAITEADFARRIRLVNLVMEDDGAFMAYHDDDDMFFGHSVTVYGDLKNGLKSAVMGG